nr:unnamed protein product [Callosobruchus analis]
MNSDVVTDVSNCKVLNISCTKKKKNVFQAVVEVDKISYERAINAGNLFVGYDSCPVFDALEIDRCYNCNEFQHFKKFCKNKLFCPRCGENHLVEDCRSNQLRCSNCVKLVNKGESNISVEHACWNINACSAYNRARDKLRSDLLNMK